MGVFSVFKRFILILYSCLLTFVVFVNLVSYSGIDLFSSGFLTSIDNGNNFENSYFGFQSIINAIADYPTSPFSQFLPKIISVLIDGLSGGATRTAIAYDLFTSGHYLDSVLNLLEGLIDIAFAPVAGLLAILSAALILLGEIWNFIFWFAKVVGGFYNIPTRTM